MPFPHQLIWEAIGASEFEIRYVNWHNPSSIRKSSSIFTVTVDKVFKGCHFLSKEYVYLDIVQFYQFKIAASFILCCMSAEVMKASVELWLLLICCIVHPVTLSSEVLKIMNCDINTETVKIILHLTISVPKEL